MNILPSTQGTSVLEGSASRPSTVERDSWAAQRTPPGTSAKSNIPECEARCLFPLGMRHQVGALTETEGTDFPRGVFPDAEAMKLELRAQLSRPQYCVEQYYHTHGFAQWIARHPRFESFTLVAIVLNSIWIAVDVDTNEATVLLESQPHFQILENLFCMFFLYEWTVRFLAFRNKLNCFRDAWFLFDSALVVLMVLETWILTAGMLFGGGGASGLGNASVLRMARPLRLSRMARITRILRSSPELMILIKGVMASMRSVLYTLCLLLIVIYVWAIAFTSLCDSTSCESLFPDVLASMQVLFVHGALMDNIGVVIRPLSEQGLLFLVLFYSYLFLSALTFLNMLVGVICEVVSAVAATERLSLTLHYLHDKIKDLMKVTDDDDDGMITRAEFMHLLKNKQAVRILKDVGVDVVGLVDFVDTIFEVEPQMPRSDGSCSEILDAEQEKKLGFSEFMGVVLDLRGTNPATVKDIIELRRYVTARLGTLERRLMGQDGIRTTITPNGCSGRDIGGGVAPKPAGRRPASAASATAIAATAAVHSCVSDAVAEITAAHEREVLALREEIRQLLKSGPTGNQGAGDVWCEDLEVEVDLEAKVQALDEECCRCGKLIDAPSHSMKVPDNRKVSELPSNGIQREARVVNASVRDQSLGVCHCGPKLQVPSSSRLQQQQQQQQRHGTGASFRNVPSRSMTGDCDSPRIPGRTLIQECEPV